MLFLNRIRHSRLECLPHQCKRWYFQIPAVSSTNLIAGVKGIKVLEMPNSVIRRSPTELSHIVRFYAAPIQAKPKPEEKDLNGPRINDQIKADFVRLVTDDGHNVVSRYEALERARNLKLDLVEVQRTAKPPVCKIMDFHKEKYKQQLKDKDRVKSKSEVTLRKGDCKEVRIAPKIEQKDIEMKAHMVKRLMERGYRVKCMAMGNEDQDLGGLLSRLSALIEDVAIIESGPRVEKKQAYVIVRHIKFGPSKKGPSKKAATVLQAMSAEVQKSAGSPPTVYSSSPIQTPVQIKDWASTESGLETEDEIFPGQSVDFEQVFNLHDNVKKVASSFSSGQMNSAAKMVSPLEDIDFNDLLCPKPVPGPTKATSVLSSPPKPSLEDRFSYSGGNEARSRFQPMKSSESNSTERKQFTEHYKFSSPVKGSHDDRVPVAMDSAKLGPQLPNRGRQPQASSHVSLSTKEQIQLGINASSLRYSKQPPEDETLKQGQPRLGTSSTPAPSYGIFSTTKNAASGNQVPANKERSLLDSTQGSNSGSFTGSLKPPTSRAESSQKPDADKARGGGGWGIFSNEPSIVNQSRISDNQVKVER